MLFTQEQKLKLTAPISEDAFCGVYLKSDRAAFRPLRNAFNVAQTSLRKLSQNPDGNELEQLQIENQSNWDNLSSELISVFNETSRDIELIGWFTSTQLFTNYSGEGFANAFEWLSNLVTEHWNELNPVLPENKLKTNSVDEQQVEQAEAKFKAFAQLIGDSDESSLLYAPFLMHPLIGDITYFDYQSAERKGELAELKSVAVGLIAQERDVIEARLENFERALTYINGIQSVLNELGQKFNLTSPSFSFINHLISGVCKATTFLTGVSVAPAQQVIENVQPETTSSELQVSNEASQMSSARTEDAIAMQATTLSSSMQGLSQTAAMNSMNRNIAFHQLREIANYFRESEPHSPVSFLLEKAIRWGNMSLPELLTVMVTEPDGDLLNRIFNTTGLDNGEQVSLPKIIRPVSSVKPVSGVSKPMSPTSKVTAEMPVSDVNSTDADLNLKQKIEASTGSTALSW
ncbi:type VI secretion protein [Shewanella sp. OPT22]|nr:type VI secretion protein [Shewanella sp. OPT22]